MASSLGQLGSPSFVKALLSRNREVRATLSQMSDTNSESTASFYYDVPGSGLKSTQQLNVDWSKFQNHVFFNSAEVSTNVAFDRVVNHFPFDGAKRDLEKFFESLTGFEKWVYDRFPKNVGYLNFSGSAATGSVGTFISVSGLNGAGVPTLSTDKLGTNVLDPGLRSFSLESHIYIPAQTNGNQVVFQKLSDGTNGFSFHLEQTSSTTQCVGTLAVVSGSECVFTSFPLTKGRFNHVCVSFDRSPRKNKAQIFVDARLVAESTSSYALGNLGSAAAALTIGSGSAVRFNGITVTPGQTFSGSIDEFRFYHEARSEEALRASATKSVFASPALKLYYKFNEPSGTLLGSTAAADNGIIIDSSGNELHAYVSNFSFANRSTGSLTQPITNEKVELSPVLFPAFTDTLSLNTNLLLSASEYDGRNPNLITRLVPSHYFREGKELDGMESEEGTIGDSYTGTGAPGTGELGAAQLLSSFLYVWAKFFDEMKLYIDAFATLNNVDYNNPDTAPDNFLPFLFSQMGFDAPSFFSDASIQQYIDAENIQSDFGTNQHALQYVQNQIHRRILTNLSDVIKSKGTIHSVKAFIRAIGIDPDNSIRIREFGGPTRRQLSSVRERRTQQHYVVDMSDRSGYFVSPPLSGSRTEVGFPLPVGTMVRKETYPPHGISNSASDALLTSGSFTFEGTYKYPVGRRITPASTQSLVRLVVTGSAFTSTSDGWGTLVNIVATSGSTFTDIPAVRAYVRGRENLGTIAPTLVMQITGANVFDGEKWSVSFGRSRNDEFGSYASSSYFLRLARQDGSEIVESYVTSSYFSDRGSSSTSPAFEFITGSTNASGSCIVIGNRAVSSGASLDFLNDSTNVPAEARASTFEGQFSMIKFWSRALTEDEWREHARNYRSVGVSSPWSQFSFNTVATGSFGRLRTDISIEQTTLSASSQGALQLFDFSQNTFHLAGSGLTANRKYLLTDTFSYSMISPAIDEAATTDKVRARSFLSYKNVVESDVASVAPVYDPEPSETPTDDTRFTIEFSVIDALNRDITNIFATLNDLDNSLGDPQLMFDSDYPGLVNIRDIYFNRLTGKVNLRAFFEYFKWFDASISSFIEQLIPRKTRFFGTNFVVESHMLERARKRYFHGDTYLGETARIVTSRDILVQQIVGAMRKF